MKTRVVNLAGGLMLCCCALTVPLLMMATVAAADSWQHKQARIVREQLLLDGNWKFAFGNAGSPADDFSFGLGSAFAKAGDAVGAARPDFNDSSWRIIHIPHDWAVEQDFVNVKDGNVMSHGYKPIGRQFPKTTIGWYRRTFAIARSDSGRRIAVRFDGVFRDCILWFNGHYMGQNLSGYSEFSFDITDYIRFGEKNVLVLRVDATQSEGWFYEGAGIYRHVWLLKYDPLHIPEYGVFASSETEAGHAQVRIETAVINEGEGKTSCRVYSILRDESGTDVGHSDTEQIGLGIGEQKAVLQQIQVSQPLLWSLKSPHLYTLTSLVTSAGAVHDSVTTSLGIRTVRFDKDKGLFLNGKPVKIQGVCCHQDHAGVGSALPDRLQYYRIERLKEMGCNAYRTSHNPPTRELLEACDRLGMLVLDENRLMGSSPELMQEFERLIRRDRNHPSVVLWSLGNEEWIIQGNGTGRNIALSLMRRLKELDPTRSCTYAANNGNQFEGINSVIPIRGINYLAYTDIDKYRKDHPAQSLLGSEEASTVCTRGIYINDTIRGYVCDYDSMRPDWGATAEKWWTFYAARPWLAGAFVWTGFDYRGEPTPYSWPCINSHFGIMDVCGFPKSNFYYYQAWWSDKDVLYLFPHWNWKAGEVISVWCHSNCDSVQLLLNGKNIGTKRVTPNRHLEWRVPFEAGTLEARGWKNGRMMVARRETTGIPAKIHFAPDRLSILANGEDLCVVNVTALDAEDREVPVADNLLHFDINGQGTIIGVGNGDPSSHEPDKCTVRAWQRRLFNGKCQVIVQSGPAPGVIELTASGDGVRPETLSISTTPCPPRASVGE